MRIISILLVFAVLALGLGLLLNRPSGPLPSFLQRPEFAGWQAHGEDSYSAPGASMKLSLKADQLMAATVKFDKLEPERAGQILGALTGFGDQVAQSFPQYVQGKTLELSQPGGVTEQAGAFRVNTQIKNGALELDVRVVEVPKESFVATNNGIGPKDAKVVIREFSDFECPYCEKLHREMLKTYLKQLPRDVRFEFHHLPLESIHPAARPAAEASECAADQGQFWAFHDALFGDRTWIQAPNKAQAFSVIASKLGLKTNEFDRCVQSNAHKALVDTGVLQAQRLNIGGTPTVFVNGYKLENPYDKAALERLIALARG